VTLPFIYDRTSVAASIIDVEDGLTTYTVGCPPFTWPDYERCSADWFNTWVYGPSTLSFTAYAAGTPELL
jgi:hypothetical protein